MWQSESRGGGDKLPHCFTLHLLTHSLKWRFGAARLGSGRFERVKSSAPGKSPARDAHCVPVYPAEQTVVVTSRACKLNLCCCTNGRVLQLGKIQPKFITIQLQLECSHSGGHHTLWFDCTTIVV